MIEDRRTRKKPEGEAAVKESFCCEGDEVVSTAKAAGVNEDIPVRCLTCSYFLFNEVVGIDIQNEQRYRVLCPDRRTSGVLYINSTCV